MLSKKIEVSIFPRTFNIMAFYSRGHYAIQIALISEQSDGSKVYAMPKIVTPYVYGSQQDKKSCIKYKKQQKQAYFMTDQFHVMYSRDLVNFYSMAVFSIQIEQNSTAKLYLEFKLMIIKYVIDTNQLNSKQNNKNNHPDVPIKKKTYAQMDCRRLYINSVMDLDVFKRVSFPKGEYFSYLDCYISSIYLGTRFRMHKYQLCEFYSMEQKTKIQKHIECDNKRLMLQSDSQKGEFIKKYVDMTVQEFRIKYNSELCSGYLNLRRKMLMFIKFYEDQNVYVDDKIKRILNQQIQIQTKLKTKQQLMDYYLTANVNELYYEVYKQMVQYDQFISYLWSLHQQLVVKMPSKIFNSEIQRYQIRENAQKDNYLIGKMKIQPEIRKSEQQKFIKRRKQLLNSLKVYEDSDAYYPFFMLENYHQNSRTPQNSQQIDSLVVFVHGYQGSFEDLEKASNFLSQYNKKCYSLLIKSIQFDMDEDIQTLGKKVAQQILSHVTSQNLRYNFRKISLVGYSLGGIIARESIKHLSELKDKMNLLVTFASPHLGVCLPDNRLVGTGVWYLINFQKVVNLKQLNCEKLQQREQIFLNKLSENDNISWFKKMIVVSSQQDNFIPHHSSRISQQISHSQIHTMSKSILSRVNKIERVQLWFDVDHETGTFQKMIGRRAHIQFLENNIFLDVFFRLYGPQF